MGEETKRILDRAKSNLENNNQEHALRLFNEILNKEPGNIEALRSKALIRISEGDRDKAEKFLLFAIEQQPDDDQLQQMLGTFYLNNDTPKKAFPHLKCAVEINPSNSIAHYGLALLYAHYRGNHHKAVSHFSRVIEISDDSADALFNRGCSYMILQDMERAEYDFRKAAKLEHSKAHEMLQEYFEK